ncbi:MAG: hypothetical protein R6X34_15930 [Chloroflexota bacterium]
MKIVTGLFTPEDAFTTIDYLTDNGFTHSDLSLVSSAKNIPSYLEGDPEESAAAGAMVGGVAGGTLAALGSWVGSTIPGLASMAVAGLLTTAIGGVVGAYLGSLYTVRADTQAEMNVVEALANGKFLLVVNADEMGAETAVSFMSEGENVEIHVIPVEDFNEVG